MGLRKAYNDCKLLPEGINLGFDFYGGRLRYTMLTSRSPGCPRMGNRICWRLGVMKTGSLTSITLTGWGHRLARRKLDHANLYLSYRTHGGAPPHRFSTEVAIPYPGQSVRTYVENNVFRHLYLQMPMGPPKQNKGVK